MGYGGYFTLEADRHFVNYTEDKVMDGVKVLYNAARELADMFESL